MTSRARLGRVVPAVLVVAAAFLLAPDRAQAQFGFGGSAGASGAWLGVSGSARCRRPRATSIRSRWSMPAARAACPSRDVYAEQPQLVHQPHPR